MSIILAFETEQLREICRSEVVAYSLLPPYVAQKLLRRIADIRAATCILKIPLGNPKQVDGKPPGEVCVDICDGYYLMLSAAHQKIPLDGHGNVAWDEVSRIKLIDIGGLYD